jgi:hypothetical protein
MPAVFSSRPLLSVFHWILAAALSLWASVSGAQPMPALGMGLNGISDWSTQHPFIDLMKSARPWVGHLPDQWGGVDAEAMELGGYLDENGWPILFPPNVEKLETFVLTDQPEEGAHLAGTYVVTYEGSGTVSVGGLGKRPVASGREIRFRYTPGGGLVSIAIEKTDPNDPIRNIRVFREDHVDLIEAGVLFNPDWIAKIQDLRVVRFMDWMATNGSPISAWGERPVVSDYTYARRGVPLEVMLALANQIGADPWFTMPHLADDTYVRNFAKMVLEGLDTRLHSYVEYSNEVWNFIFPQAQWAQAEAEPRWGDAEAGWMQFYGLKAALVMNQWSDIWGDQAGRLVRVFAAHTGWPGLEQAALHGEQATEELGADPADSFDAYAITGYFGHDIGAEEHAARLLKWIDDSEAEAIAAGEAEGLRRVALREFVKTRRFDTAYPALANHLQANAVTELVEDLFPKHAEAAEAEGLTLIMYEGGTHVVATGPLADDERVTEFLTSFNYRPEMGDLYMSVMEGWLRAGGVLFNGFVDVAPPSKWGSWGALRHLSDSSPRWDALMTYNAIAPHDWEDRDPTGFENGAFLAGTNGPDRLAGTVEEDILIGGPGDDSLWSGAGNDHLIGGDGEDTALLYGPVTAYRFAQVGKTVIASSKFGTVVLHGIEKAAFTSGDAAAQPISDLLP